MGIEIFRSATSKLLKEASKKNPDLTDMVDVAKLAEKIYAQLSPLSTQLQDPSIGYSTMNRRWNEIKENLPEETDQNHENINELLNFRFILNQLKAEEPLTENARCILENYYPDQEIPESLTELQLNQMHMDVSLDISAEFIEIITKVSNSAKLYLATKTKIILKNHEKLQELMRNGR